MSEYTVSDVHEQHRKFSLDNWHKGGATRHYSFLHTPEFFPHAWIHRAGRVCPLEVAPISGITGTKAVTSLGENTLESYMAFAPIDGWLVLHHGKIAYEKYPGMRPHDKHIWWSSSKSIVGTIIGILEDEGRINVHRPVEAYIPELRLSEWARTPVIDVLDMASGMAGLEADDPQAYTHPDSPYGLFEASLGIMPPTTKTMASTYDYVKTLSRLRPSGEAFEYTSVNTFVLSWIVEQVTEMPYAELVSEMIWQKIGAESDALMAVSHYGAPGSHAMMNTILRDKGRYGLLFTPSWSVVSKEKIVSDAMIQRIQNGGRPEIFDKGALGRNSLNTLPEYDRPLHNTYQWDVVWGDGDFYKGGYGGQGIYVSPLRDLVIVWFASGTEQEVSDTMAYARAIATSGLFRE